MVKKPPPSGRPTLNLRSGGALSASKLQDVMTPAAGASYCASGAPGWSRVKLSLQRSPLEGSNVSPIVIALALEAARSANAVDAITATLILFLKPMRSRLPSSTASRRAYIERAA
jgi:hypothetical protein